LGALATGWAGASSSSASRSPLADALHGWLTAQLARVSGKSGLAEAIRYALRHWPGLALFLEDGRLELDTDALSGVRRHDCTSPGRQRLAIA
jgi:hypothetical protein